MFHTGSDVEVIAHLYDAYGERFVERLDGMFAFLLYDSRRQTFLAGRDRFGMKSLYYTHEAGRWHFASEAKALKAAGVDVSRIQELPAGCYLNEAGVHRFYDLGAHRRASVPDPKLLFTLLDASIRRHLMVDPSLRVGVLLSGGLDSSAVAALAARHRPDVVAFTIGLSGKSSDVIAARSVAAHLGIEHVVVPFDLNQVWDLLPAAVYTAESYNPMIVLETLLASVLARAVAAHGIKVVLCGEGADEIFAGYGVFRTLPRPQVAPALRSALAQIGTTECRRLDRGSMAYSVEARVPFLDPQVVEYAVNLPMDALLHNDAGQVVEKWLLRKAVEDLLPRDLVWRAKVSFDQGAGVLPILDRIAAAVSDDELAAAQDAYPHARLRSKAAVFLYALFREHYGDLGGSDVSELCGSYPLLDDAIHSRTVEGGTGEGIADMARLRDSVTGSPAP